MKYNNSFNLQIGFPSWRQNWSDVYKTENYILCLTYVYKNGGFSFSGNNSNTFKIISLLKQIFYLVTFYINYCQKCATLPMMFISLSKKCLLYCLLNDSLHNLNLINCKYLTTTILTNLREKQYIHVYWSSTVNNFKPHNLFRF